MLVLNKAVKFYAIKYTCLTIVIYFAYIILAG